MTLVKQNTPNSTLPSKHTSEVSINQEKRNLIESLSQIDLYAIGESENVKAAFTLITLANKVSIASACQAPHIFIVRQSLGEEITMKLVCFVLKQFSDSLKLPRKMTTMDIIEAALLILNKYPHESIEDIILAFRVAKTRGRKLYAGLSVTDIFDIIGDYLAEKSAFLEAHRNRLKAEKNQIAKPDQMPDGLKKILQQFDESKKTRQLEAETRFAELQKYARDKFDPENEEKQDSDSDEFHDSIDE